MMWPRKDSHQVNGHSFLPFRLIQNAGIVTKNVDSTKCFHSFLQGLLKTGIEFNILQPFSNSHL